MGVREWRAGDGDPSVLIFQCDAVPNLSDCGFSGKSILFASLQPNNSILLYYEHRMLSLEDTDVDD